VPFSPELRFVIVGSPAYLQDHPAPAKPGDLMAHRCIRARWPSGALYRWEFEKQGRALTIDVPGSLTLDEPTLMRRRCWSSESSFALPCAPRPRTDAVLSTVATFVP
jgi:DNA-binding transcriptional LysR family regulator